MEPRWDVIRPDEAYHFDVPDLRGQPTSEAQPAAYFLPTPTSPLVGRQRELAEVAALIRRDDVRLLTLTGAGGTGKTRLALAVGHALEGEFHDGAGFVALARITDPDLVASVVAASLGVREEAGVSLGETLGRQLRAGELLLVVDNFERLLPAADLLVGLLEAAPRLKLLVTSRTALHASGEHEYPVPPLALPRLRPPPPLEALSQYEAVALFIQRASAENPDFEITAENAPAVAEICVRLDGLPLAIELAAAWVKMLSPQALLARLDARLSLLTGGARDLPAHQQTLRGTLDWSHSLLAPPEQRLFARLAVFAGGATVEAAEAVCNHDRTFGGDLLRPLSSLLDKSLLRRSIGRDQDDRFVMLETVREYALERLNTSGERGDLLNCYAHYFLQLAQQAEPALLAGSEQAIWYQRLESEHDNFREALAWVRATGDSSVHGSLAASLWRFWLHHGYLSEWREHIAQALANTRDERPQLRVKVLRAAGILADRQGRYGEAQSLFEERLALVRQVGEETEVVRALSDLGLLATETGEFEQASSLFEESLALGRQAELKFQVAVDTLNVGYLAVVTGDLERATRLLRESIDLFRELDDEEGISMALENLGLAAIADGRYQQALEFGIQSLKISARHGRISGIATALLCIARVAVEATRLDRACRLLGAVEALTADAPLSAYERRLFAETVARVRVELGEYRSERSLAEGRAMTSDEAVAFAASGTAD